MKLPGAPRAFLADGGAAAGVNLFNLLYKKKKKKIQRKKRDEQWKKSKEEKILHPATNKPRSGSVPANHCCRVRRLGPSWQALRL
jgi:hypothetical protein